jgi:hypothetical protein
VSKARGLLPFLPEEGEREADAFDLTKPSLVFGPSTAGQQVVLDLVETGQHFRIYGKHRATQTSLTEMILKSGWVVSNRRRDPLSRRNLRHAFCRVCRSISEVSVVMPRCQAPQPSEVLAAEPALCRLDSNEVRVSESLVVGVLGIVPAAIGVDETREGSPSPAVRWEG